MDTHTDTHAPQAPPLGKQNGKGYRITSAALLQARKADALPSKALKGQGSISYSQSHKGTGTHFLFHL